MRFEPLERRDLLATMEGSVFSLSTNLTAAGLSGDLTASIDWGDGSTGVGSVSDTGVGPLQARFDYSLDDNNFFDTQAKRDLLELATSMVVSQLGDQLTAITPGGDNSWSMTLVHPATGVQDFEISNPTVAANELVIYAGGRELTGTSLGVGGPGGSSATCATPGFCSDVATRGQTGAAAEPPTDFGPWGGSLSFDTDTNWHFGETTIGLDNDESDFLSVASHEVTHLLGFGASLAWNGLVSGAFFTGATSAAANGGSNVPLSGSGHWENGTTHNGQEAAMDPSLTNGTRKLLTQLDLAGLDDVGWEIVDTQLTVAADHTYADNGEYDVDVVVTGSSGGSVSTSVSETVTNADPVVSAPGNGTVLVGQTVSFADIGLLTDAGFGSSESFTYTIDWNDGSPDTTGTATIDQAGSPGILTSGSFDATHIFSSTGAYTVSVTVEDDDTGTNSDTFQVTVLDVSWHNSANVFDVNADSAVSAVDALIIINDLNANGSRSLSTPTANTVPPFIDVTDDGYLSPLDALQVINFVNDQSSNPEGEGGREPVGVGVKAASNPLRNSLSLSTIQPVPKRRHATAIITERVTPTAILCRRPADEMWCIRDIRRPDDSQSSPADVWEEQHDNSTFDLQLDSDLDQIIEELLG
ncbi:MAG: hypothetical protein CMJ64_22000 [Planctomycetaceae bacterium]|nr:hypothetical protein [Planctomycetaceae bacterium]